MISFDYMSGSSLPRPYDLVWTLFPEHASITPSVKARPGLVRMSGYSEDKHPQVDVVYGTSNIKFGRRLLDLHVCNLAHMDACNLDYPTRFDLDHIVTLPWSRDFFIPKPGYTKIVFGHLSDGMKDNLHAIMEVRKNLNQAYRDAQAQ